LIELKFALGVENTTKDVSNSWRLIVVIGDSKVQIINKKRELCVENRFELEWELTVSMARPALDYLNEIDLKVVSSDFSLRLNSPLEISEKKKKLMMLMKLMKLMVLTFFHDDVLLPSKDQRSRIQ